MAQFDVHRLADGGLVVDCQAESFAFLATRFVVPLIPLEGAPDHREPLNPIFEISGDRFLLMTQFAAAMRKAELRHRVTSLESERYSIQRALDLLITGV